MSTPPPDPDPDRTPGLEEGGGVAPGDTPPESAQTSGVSHRQPGQPRSVPVVAIVAAIVLALLVAGLLIALGVGALSL